MYCGLLRSSGAVRVALTSTGNFSRGRCDMYCGLLRSSGTVRVALTSTGNNTEAN